MNRKPTILMGIWLSLDNATTSIEPLLLQMLEDVQPDTNLCHAILEELTRPVKLKDVVLAYLGLQEVEVDREGEVSLFLVSSTHEQNPWRDALLLPQSSHPIGFVVNTWDYGRVAVVHEIFHQFTTAQQGMIRQYATLAVRGKTPKQILAILRRRQGGIDDAIQIMQEARRRMQSLEHSILFSHDGEIRVQLGSLSQTTKTILREGLHGEYLFILPRHLFVGKTNYADIEFIVYLNFFVCHGRRTRIAGTAGQHAALRRLLNLTLFGLFSPELPELPRFTELQRLYGVADRQTYAFLHLCYELYSVRKTPDLSSAILGLDDYIDMVQLHDIGQPTHIPIQISTAASKTSRLGTVRVIPQEDDTFTVRITQPSGHATTKRLMVPPPVKVVTSIPTPLRQAVQFATNRPRFGVMPLGTSHGFDPEGDLTTFVIWINGQGILVDPSPESLGYLAHMGVAQTDLLYVFLTHVHADHDGGLLEKLLGGSRTTIIASDVVFQLFIEKTLLITGHDFQREGLVQHVAANPGAPVELYIAGERLTLETRWNLHPIPTNGFKLTMADQCFGYSGDTQYDPDLIQKLRDERQLSHQHVEALRYFFWTPEGAPMVDLLYHEAGIPPIHTDRRQLERLPPAVKTRTALVHIADRDVPADAVPGKPPLFTTHTLLPSTAQSRQETVLRTLALVSYLYDVPRETLQGLLDMGTIRVFTTAEPIFRQGPISQGTPVTFCVVIDGEVAVKDGRRWLATLLKGDSFGEWGISHQRGFRTADVIAASPVQLLEFDEAAYRWMIARHPAVQERIGRIRALLPRLQGAQARAHQYTREHPERVSSVIEDMNTSRLSAFALFSVTKMFRQGMPVIIEGEVADGFYILLSGHLAVTIEGRSVGELSEGDVFGEVGLIEGGKRMATVSVMSADAEVLVMSQQNFHALLHTVPAFSFGIHTTADLRATAAQHLYHPP